MMADYFTRLSIEVDLPEAAARWAIALAERLDALIDADGEQLPPSGDAALDRAALEITAADPVGTGCDWFYRPDRLWVSADESAEPDAIAAVLQHTLRHFELAGAITLQWSWDCSKLRANAFGGGAAMVTATSIETFTTAEWLDRQLAKLEPAACNQLQP
jgi:hypothetical protein